MGGTSNGKVKVRLLRWRYVVINMMFHWGNSVILLYWYGGREIYILVVGCWVGSGR